MAGATAVLSDHKREATTPSWFCLPLRSKFYFFLSPHYWGSLSKIFLTHDGRKVSSHRFSREVGIASWWPCFGWEEVTFFEGVPKALALIIEVVTEGLHYAWIFWTHVYRQCDSDPSNVSGIPHLGKNISNNKTRLQQLLHPPYSKLTFSISWK